MKTIIFSLYQHPMLNALCQCLNAEKGVMINRSFPDGESYLRIESEVLNQVVILLDSLDRPNVKTLPIIYAARTLRELGAKKIIFCAPYLAYMRQDKLFNQGEALTSKYYAELLSRVFDGLVTLDPHLHRYDSLNDIYRCETTLLHATDPIANWLELNIQNPLLIGPDSESKQWVEIIATKINAPFFVFEKDRKGDQEVRITAPDLSQFKERSPVLIDDIISSAGTMIAGVHLLKKALPLAPVCIGVHALFAKEAYASLQAANPKDIITCNSVFHETNKIDVSTLFANALAL
jgi:ribose-phosphate pyrophosphokinase